LAIHGLGIARLCLSYPDDAFFIVVVDFDLPAIDTGLNQRLQVEGRIGPGEERGLAVEESGTLAQAMPGGFDDDQKQRLIMAGLAPEDGTRDFDLEVPDLPDRIAGDPLRGDLVIAQDFFGSGSFGTALARPTFGLSVYVQREAKVSLLADAPDESVQWWKPPEQNLVGVVAVDGSEEYACQSFKALIQSVAETTVVRR
jgi:hypothetical protein